MEIIVYRLHGQLALLALFGPISTNVSCSSNRETNPFVALFNNGEIREDRSVDAKSYHRGFEDKEEEKTKITRI
jgi:hypothetical protein